MLAAERSWCGLPTMTTSDLSGFSWSPFMGTIVWRLLIIEPSSPDPAQRRWHSWRQIAACRRRTGDDAERLDEVGDWWDVLRERQRPQDDRPLGYAVPTLRHVRGVLAVGTTACPTDTSIASWRLHHRHRTRIPKRLQRTSWSMVSNAAQMSRLTIVVALLSATT